MTRPWVLVFLLVFIVLTSQFEWRQQIGSEMETGLTRSHKEQHISQRRGPMKEKIILSQEIKIRKLNELVQSLRQQLLQCRSKNQVINGSVDAFTELLTELDRLPFMDD